MLHFLSTNLLGVSVYPDWCDLTYLKGGINGQITPEYFIGKRFVLMSTWAFCLQYRVNDAHGLVPVYLSNIVLKPICSNGQISSPHDVTSGVTVVKVKGSQWRLWQTQRRSLNNQSRVLWSIGSSKFICNVLFYVDIINGFRMPQMSLGDKDLFLAV